MSDYTPTIGLEVHAELKTRTKMFCNSANDPDERRPNWNVCPVCMGHPGTLPVINKQAVAHVLKVGAAVGGQLADYSEFDRKNYFYPDIPKGYQISQYAHPLVKDGELAGVKLTRIHLEEDTALSKHGGDHSFIDFNRAGIPLMELVTEPVMHSAGEAVAFAKELQLLLRYLGVSDADMEKGHLRLEANVSVSKDKTLGTKVEVKNINSFRFLERAIEYEIKRQSEALESGAEVAQETRGWNDAKQETHSQRSKEDSHDYRYFPEPDLPKLKLSEIPEFAPELIHELLPELPWARRGRYLAAGLKDEDAEMFVADAMYGDFFDAVMRNVGHLMSNNIRTLNVQQRAANYIAADLAGLLKGERGIPIAAQDFAELITMISDGGISSRGAKDILRIMVEKGGTPKEIAEKENLLQQSDESALEAFVQKVIEENPQVIADYKSGKTSVLQFLVGQAMKLSRGSANPQSLQEIFKRILD